ncbi:MAG: DNA polymerase III subunit alpha [Magnetococcales bacterium]|nr:DNA polymerase III subunit alpha [Magnetococcales bacterium]
MDPGRGKGDRRRNSLRKGKGVGRGGGWSWRRLRLTEWLERRGLDGASGERDNRPARGSVPFPFFRELRAVSFVHLHVHSGYSLLASTARVEALAARAKSQEMPALALTDQGNLFAAVQFYSLCLKKGIKPILGAQIYLVPDRFDKNTRPDKEVRDQLILLARNREGWKNLVKVVSAGHLEGSHGKPRVDWKVLSAHAGGLIALSAGLKGETARLLREGKEAEARASARRLAELFGNTEGAPNFFIEIQRHEDHPDEEALNQQLIGLAYELNLPLVASNDVHFLDPKDQRAQDALLCIGLGHTLFEENRPRLTPRYHFASPQEMAALFADLPEALSNTVMIARRCNVQLVLGKPMLPDFHPPEGHTLESWMRHEAEAGLAMRLETQVFPITPPEKRQETARHYKERLDFELDVIVQMGFPGYFLIVSDFIRWAKEQGIPVGPGRGSGAGSLAAWVLQITDLDPIRYHLLFERFLNPERVSMPDFDVDFCMDRREEVIGYVQQRYGRERVAQIITFGTLQAKAAIRDVGRVLEFPYPRVDGLAKLVPNVLGITLEQAIKDEEKLRELMKQEPEVRELMELAMAVEGLPRSAGTHAAGVVIANTDITDSVPLYLDPRSPMPVTQFYMGDVEKAGMVKFDFLGLKTLTVIDDALRMINERLQREGGGAPVDISRIPLDDAATYRLLKEGRTRGVFQLESSGMREILKKLAPDTIEEVIALVALYRPGPLESGMVDDFINRKHGRAQVEYLLPQLEPILKETYGVILYQEQVMKIAQSLASYTLGGADLLRRAMGKKKPEEMAAQRKIFLSGTESNALDSNKSGIIFDLMEKFAGYGFNKSHSAAYALIAYQTAWLKTHYPVEFLAATLTCDMLNTDKIMPFVRECREMGITVLPPDVNHSGVAFTVEAGAVRYGLAAVKNVGQGAMEKVVEERRRGGLFTSLFDLTRRIEPGALNRRSMEQLIRAGGCDSLGGPRSALLAALPAAMSQGAKTQEDRSHGVRSLFGEEEEPTRESLPQVPEFTTTERLAQEKEALGFYLTGHPLQKYERELSAYGLEDAQGVRQLAGPGRGGDPPRVSVAGMISERKTHRTRSGERMAFITLEDPYGRIEAVVFPEGYKSSRAAIDGEGVVVVTGNLEAGEEEEAKLIDAVVQPLDDYRAERCREARLEIPHHALTEEALDRLREALRQNAGGNCRVVVGLKLPRSLAWFRLGEGFAVHPREGLLDALMGLFGESSTLFTSERSAASPEGSPPYLAPLSSTRH